jgi:hypothetical protein
MTMDNHGQPDEYDLLSAEARRFLINLSCWSFVAGVALGFILAIAIAALAA